MTGDDGRWSLVTAKVMIAEDSGGNVDEPMSREVKIKSHCTVNGMSNLQRLHVLCVILVIVTPRL